MAPRSDRYMSQANELQHAIAGELRDDDGLPGLCQGGIPHTFDGVECTVCGVTPEIEDSPYRMHPHDTRDEHPCFEGCRHYTHRRD